MKKQLPKFNEIDLKVLFEAMNKAYENAYDYYYEAELCYRIRSYGHSQALSILGIEELGKSSGYLLLFFLKILPESLRKMSDINPDKVIKDIHGKHNVKLMLSFNFSLLFDKLLDLLKISKEFEEELDSTSFSRSMDEMSNIQKKIQEKVKQKFRNKKRLENEMEFIENLQRYKELGMYVEIEDKPTHVSYPRRMKAKNPKRCLDILDRYLDLFSYIPEVQWDEIENSYNDLKVLSSILKS